jgi:dipeptidyl aminopeptidase/acylaminoacyl peptidase
MTSTPSAVWSRRQLAVLNLQKECEMDSSFWVGEEEHFGVPSMLRPDAPKAKTWSLEAIAAVERPHHAALAPDRSQVSFILDRDTSDVWTVNLVGGALSRITTGREPAAYWEDDPASWSPGGAQLAFSADGSVWIVAVSGGLPVEIGEGSGAQWINENELVYIVERDEESRIVRRAVKAGWPTAVTPPGMNVAGAVVSTENGKILFVDYPKDDRSASNIWVHDLADGSNLQLTAEPGMQDLQPRLSPDGTRVAFTSERSGWRHVYLVGVDGSELRQVTADEGDFSALDWDASGNRLIAVRSRRGVDDLVVIDTSAGSVDVVSAGGEWSSVAWAKDVVIAIHESSSQPPRLVSVDLDGVISTLVEGVPASIRTASYAPLTEVTYPSFDGMEIHGFLLRPSGDGPFPAVVYPHGGPTGVFGDQWDGHAQYFVERGYAWFGVNFRGSTTFGRDFERANYNTWGVGDTEDCLAAAEYLGSLDWVDESRIGIFGASYGSYMALASLVRDPEHRFACGVAKYGDSDIATSWASGDRGGREDLEKMMGTPAENRQAYRDGSPLSMVDNIDRPILVAHGELDERVHPDQSSQLVEELKRLNKTFEYVTYPTEGHGLLRAGPQVDFYQRLERFLDWYLM